MSALAGIASFFANNASIISMVTQAFGMFQQAQGQKDAYMAQSEAMGRAAEAADEDARQAVKASAREEYLKRLQVRAIMGKTAADAANRGLDPNTGTPLLLLKDNMLQGERDIWAIRRTGEINASRAMTVRDEYYNKSSDLRGAASRVYSNTLLTGVGGLFNSGLSTGLIKPKASNDIDPFFGTGGGAAL